MTYAVLIYSGRDHEPPEPEMSQLLDAHRKLQAELAPQGVLGTVARLELQHTGKRVRREGDGFTLTDGPYLETREWLVGFYLIDGDEEQALDAAKRICPFVGSVEVRPVGWLRPTE